ncbi:MAG: hypothetical protein KF878_04755 [Planctomycetes bacterium]|nr:hypothetical protein [Planctomycetota bacterium]
MEPLKIVPCVVCGAHVRRVRPVGLVTCGAYCRTIICRLRAEQARPAAAARRSAQGARQGARQG